MIPLLRRLLVMMRRGVPRARLVAIIAIVAMSLLWGCGKKRNDSYPSPTNTSTGHGIGIDRPTDFYRVQVFYGTNREMTSESDPARHFLGGYDHDVSLGRCLVSIPRGHKMGRVERPSILKLEFRPDPKRHVVLMQVDDLPEDDFLKALREQVSASKSKECFVFIHGFNVSFEDAACRTAQIAWDMEYDGAPIFYSWPSQAKLSLKGYRSDEEYAAKSAEQLRAFLEMVCQKSGAEKVNVIAHSMGNRVLLGALTSVATATAEQAKVDHSLPTINQIILAAPDVNTDVFKNEIAPKLKGIGTGMTLYASNHDRAMFISRRLHLGLSRLGETDPEIALIDRLQSIDASTVDTNPLGLGHSYYGKVPAVIRDIDRVLLGITPEERGLQSRTTERGKYWAFPRGAGARGDAGTADPNGGSDATAGASPESSLDAELAANVTGGTLDGDEADVDLHLELNEAVLQEGLEPETAGESVPTDPPATIEVP